jgi:predicted permease
VSPAIGFLLFLGITLAGLGGAVVTGRAARRKVHFRWVSTAVVGLGVTIYYAERLGELYDLEAAGWIYPFHLLLAKVTTGAYFVVIGSGIATIRSAARRKTHGRIAYSVLFLTVMTAVTGTWMILAAERLG